MTAMSGPSVGIIDYQAGNIHSIANAFMSLGVRVHRVRQTSDLEKCSHLVLPGVGAFGFCAEYLMRSGLTDCLCNWALTDCRPLLGICVGMQLLADRSEESPKAQGLGWMGGTIDALPRVAGIRVPHVGWNTVVFETEFGDFPAGATADFYFDHSFAYRAPIRGVTLGYCDHSARFSAIVQWGNIIAAQFHPEKSQSAGMRFLRAFLKR